MGLEETLALTPAVRMEFIQPQMNNFRTLTKLGQEVR